MNSLRKIVVIIGLCFLSITNSICATEFKWQDYKPYSIKQVMAEFDPIKSINGTVYDFGFIKYKVKVINSGKSRDIDKNSLDFISKWSKAAGQDPKMADSYKHEILVQEESQEYWLPIQEILMKPFEEEVKVSKKVNLFIMFLGIMKNGNHLFIIDEFQGE